MAGDLVGRRGEEHVAREDGVPRLLGNDSDRDAILRVGADEAILDEDLPAAKVLEQPLADGEEALPIIGHVDLAPPHVRLARRLSDDEFVVGRAPSVLPGPDDQGAVGSQVTLAPAEGFLHQRRRVEVRVRRLEASDAVILEPVTALDALLHLDMPPGRGK